MNTEKKKELDLWNQWKKSGDQQHFTGLLKSLEPLVQSHVNKFNNAQIPRTAIESQARILAAKALKTYDPSFGTQINTHIGHHMKHLHRYVLEYQNIGKIPEARGLAISRFANLKSNLTEELGREPNIIELAEALKWSTAEVERMQAELRNDIQVIQGKEEAFFDTTLNQTDTARDLVEFAYYSSGPEERKIIEYWFGFGGSPKLSVNEIAVRMNKTPAQVRAMAKEIALKIKNSQ